MELAGPSTLPLLVVTSHRPHSEALLSLLTEDGYDPLAVSSLEEALVMLEQRSFALVLTDLFAGISKHTFTPAHALRQRAQPTPVALLAAQAALVEQAPLAGFAFALPPSVDVSWLLTPVAAGLRLPLRQQQHRLARSITSFLEVWGSQEWTNLLRLCTKKIICYPTGLFPQAPSAQVQGKLALLGLVRTFRQRYQRVCLEVEGIFGRPQGLAVSYRIWAKTGGRLGML